ncbi:MAG: hypothetical protein AAGA54_09605 [Myxococcota bacterium]
MSSADKLDSFLIKSGLPYEQIADGTWVLHPESARNASLGVKIEDPIVLFSIQLFELGSTVADGHTEVFRTLLELNSELLHASYSLQGSQLVLSGAQQLENLDFNEFQAMVDDMCMALDNHYDKIAPMVQTKGAVGAEESA